MPLSLGAFLEVAACAGDDSWQAAQLSSSSRSCPLRAPSSCAPVMPGTSTSLACATGPSRRIAPMK